MSGLIDPREVSRHEYERRIGRVLAFIREHLDEDLSLRTLAGVANFSPYHFHRVFRALVGEPVGTFVRRMRIPTAARHLAVDRARPITIVARECGFSSSSAFAREFRRHFGMSASTYRKESAGRESKDGQLDRKIGEDQGLLVAYTGAMANPGNTRDIRMSVAVKTLPELHVAYMRHVGPYHTIGKAFEKLMGWAGPRGLLRFPETKVLAVYHDKPGRRRGVEAHLKRLYHRSQGDVDCGRRGGDDDHPRGGCSRWPTSRSRGTSSERPGTRSCTGCPPAGTSPTIGCAMRST